MVKRVLCLGCGNHCGPSRDRCLARLAALEQRLELETATSCRNLATTLQVEVDEDTNQASGKGKLTEKPPEAAKGDTEDPPELEPEEPNETEDAMDPVAFLETTWNLVLVAGHAGVGWIDMAIGWLLLIASAGMQITFGVILLTPSFQGEPFDESQVRVAREWRNSVAHDSKYLDLARTSLTARVCNNDGGLILSNHQAAVPEFSRLEPRQ